MEYIKSMMPLNLQHFVEEEEEGDDKAKVTTFTEDDINRIV